MFFLGLVSLFVLCYILYRSLSARKKRTNKDAPTKMVILSTFIIDPRSDARLFSNSLRQACTGYLEGNTSLSPVIISALRDRDCWLRAQSDDAREQRLMAESQLSQSLANLEPALKQVAKIQKSYRHSPLLKSVKKNLGDVISNGNCAEFLESTLPFDKSKTYVEGLSEFVMVLNMTSVSVVKKTAFIQNVETIKNCLNNYRSALAYEADCKKNWEAFGKLVESENVMIQLLFK